MKVNRLVLKDIRCFDKIEIQLGGKSALIVGDNGDGKSTLIRSLAIGLCDDSSASALFRDLHGETVRKGCKTGQIEVELGNRTEVFYTQTDIIGLKTFERVEQKLFRRSPKTRKLIPLKQRIFPWRSIFAAGYGPGLRVQGTADYDYYLTVDAVYPLFRYDTPLQNPELVVRRLIDAARQDGGQPAADRVLASIKTLLKNILQLDNQDQLELTRIGISVKGRWGRTELSSLGDGYRSTVTWILDLLCWWFLRTAHARSSTVSTDIRGIVLIDEIEQHLHPRWQRNIMRLLTETFPGVQFIVTTHSPLVASGCEGIPVHRLNQGKHVVESPFGWLAEDVYEMMGLPTTRAKRFLTDVLGEYERLDVKRLRSKLSRMERRQFLQLRRRLAELPSDDPVQLATELGNLTKRAEELRNSRE